MRSVVVLAGLLAVAQSLPGQEGPARIPREQLIGQIMERFIENYQTQAGLTTEQSEKFRIAIRRSFQQRQQLQQRERQTFRALEMQMRPGIAANVDSVTRLLDAIVEARAALVEQVRAEQREFATYLSPVQRAQLVILWERFENQIDEMIQRRQEQARQGRGGGGN